VRRSLREGPYLFVVPALLLFFSFFLYPAIIGFFYGLTGLDLRKGTSLDFIGLKNYVEALRDPLMQAAFRNSLYVAVVSSPILVFGGLTSALLVAKKGLRGKAAYATIIILPVAMPTIATSMIWEFIYDSQWGAINTILERSSLGFLTTAWLHNPTTALTAIIVTYCWTFIGFHMAIYFSIIQSIPKSIPEAAAVDGLSEFQIVTRIIMPLLKPGFGLSIVNTVAGAFTYFDFVFLMTGVSGGGGFTWTDTMILWIYRNGIAFLKIGYSSAGAAYTTLVVFALNFVILRRLKIW